MKYVELGNLNIPIVQPKKGVDYYTDIEKEEVIEEVSKRVNSTIEPMENERQTSETQRESNEEVRKSQENTRQVNENERITNEITRQNNEDTRQSNENLRLSNEQSRVEAEELRNTDFASQISKNEEALQNIKDMTVEYNENADSKMLEFNNNCQVRTEDFNNNAEIQKGNFDANANEKIAQYNAHVSELTEDISNIKDEQNLQNTKLTELENKNIEQDTEISNLKQEDITQNTNIQHNAKSIEDLQQENLELKEKLEKQNSQIPTGTPPPAENITLNDSSDLPFESFKISGNSVQNGTPTPDVPVDFENVISINVKVANGLEENAENFQSQVFDFPLSKGQKLYKDSYLADDGIHHIRKQYEFDGTEDWQVSDNKYYIRLTDKASRTVAVSNKILCNYFEENKTGLNGNTTVGKMFENFYTTGNRNVFFNYDEGVGGLTNFKTWLATKKNEGNPMILEYELGEEIIEPYTEEQQVIYDQIKKVYSYKNVTHIFSLDEVSPIIEVTYKKDLETMFNNINNALLGGN